MSPDFALQLLSQMLWVAALISAPVLLTVLLVGILINIAQVVTQIQEMSLSFIPKLIAACVVFIFAGGWMLRKLLGFCMAMFQMKFN
ncbi:flagellar biosynthetic protein FliQ [Chitiniphilus shinanonensis]|uniref:flagellar biosynthetic protein FliQ n=1 Tax=Chitiniphilus shinanonensis TaxID=553088 RepID=UPI00036AD976|nr:flagellar biosynthetic protein FliQ [Chitiniphilus shinanonensis]